MLYATINPPGQVISQLNPFSSQTINCNQICVIARPYELGSEVVNFEVQFGNLTFDELQVPTNFIYVRSYGVTLSGSQLTNWGTDDTFIIEEIASIFGTTATNFYEADFSMRI